MNHMFLLEELLNMFDSPQNYVPLLTKRYRKKYPVWFYYSTVKQWPGQWNN